MSATGSPTTSSRLLDQQDDSVPLLLSSFPVPPSFIPPTPGGLSSPLPSPLPNPPLSRPPASPLPPVPGPSPISEHDTLIFISASRSRRASKLSLASTTGSVSTCSASGSMSTRSRRDSTASVTSGSAPPLSPLSTPVDISPLRAIHSYPSNNSLSINVSVSPSSRITMEKSPLLMPIPHIEELDEDAYSTADLTHISIPDLSPMPSAAPSTVGLSDTDDDRSECENRRERSFLASLSRRRPQYTNHRAVGMNDSITSIDLRDLAVLQEEGSDFGTIPPSSPSPLSSCRLPPEQNQQLAGSRANSLSKRYPHLRPQPIQRWRRPPTAILNKDLPPLPIDDPDLQTPFSYPEHQRSTGPEEDDDCVHELEIPQRSPTDDSSSQATPTPASVFAPARPRSYDLSSKRDRDDGASSPDITQILASTPKPSVRSKSCSRLSSTRRFTRPRRAASGDCSSPMPSTSTAPLKRFNSSGPHPHSDLAYTQPKRRSQAFDDEEEDYGELIDGTGTVMDWRMLDREVEAKLEKELEGFGSDRNERRTLWRARDQEEDTMSDGSESSIDVRTPLPNLMLRDGMLSPYSKLLPQSGRSPSPYGDRRVSVASHACSIMTKSGIYKDERDTVSRRVRHRDGRLLRGGIGLTTGLGWSDSEDENAPSPLTKKISSQLLSRRSSAVSVLSPKTRTMSRSKDATTTMPVRPSPLARSVSDTLASVSNSLALHQTRIKESRPPPTSWTRSSLSSSVSSPRASTTSSTFSSHSDRLVSDSSSGYALEDIREQDLDLDQDGERDKFGAMTPSTASSSSTAMPLTPIGDDDMDIGRSWSHSGQVIFPTLGLAKTKLDAKHVVSRSNLRSPASFYRDTDSSKPGSALPPSKPVAAFATTGTPTTRTSTSSSRASVPKPLRLAQSSVLAQSGSAACINTPTVSRSTSTGNIPSPRTPRVRTASGSRIAALPVLATPSRLARPQMTLAASPQDAVQTPRSAPPPDRKPRTGTGMAYRSSSSSASSRPSLMRAPSSVNPRKPSSATRI